MYPMLHRIGLLEQAAAGGGGGGATPTLRTAVITGESPGEDGTQDFTAEGFGTPLAAEFYMVRYDTSGFHYVALSRGVTDGTNSWTISCHWSSDSFGSVATNRSATGSVLFQKGDDESTLLGVAKFDSWITDGVRIIWSSTPVAEWQIVCILYAADGGSVAVGTTSLPDTGSTVTVNVGFESNLVFLASDSDYFNNSGNGYGSHNFGVAAYDGTTLTQVAQDCAHRNDQNTSQHAVGIKAGRCHTNSSTASGGFAREATLENITSTGFDITANVGSFSGLAAGYLAFKLPADTPVWAGVVEAPTSTGSYEITDPGFEPTYAMIIQTMLDSAALGAHDDRSQSLSFGWMTADNEVAHWTGVETGASEGGSTNERGGQDASAIYVNTHDELPVFRGTLDSFGENGPILDITDADATQRYWPMWCAQ